MGLAERLAKLKEKAQEQVRSATDYAEALRISQDAEAMRQVRELAEAGDEEAKALLVDIDTAKKAAEGSKLAMAVQAASTLAATLSANEGLRVSSVVREGLATGALRECAVGESDHASVYDLDLGRVVHVSGAFGLLETKALAVALKQYVESQRGRLVEALEDGKIQPQLAAKIAVELRMGKVVPWSRIESAKAEAAKVEAEGRKRVPPHFRFSYQVNLEGGKAERRDSAFVSWEVGRDAAYSNADSFAFVGLLHTEAKRQAELMRERLPEFTLDEAEATESGNFTEIAAGRVGEAVLRLETGWRNPKDGSEQPIFVKVTRPSEKESLRVVKAYPAEAARKIFRRWDGELKTVTVFCKMVRGEDGRVTELSFEEVRDTRLKEGFFKRIRSEANMGLVSVVREERDAAYRANMQEKRREFEARATISRSEFLANKPGFRAVCNDAWKIGRTEKVVDLVDGLLEQDEKGNVRVVELTVASRKLVFGGETPDPDLWRPRRQIAQNNPRAWAWIMTANDTPSAASSEAEDTDETAGAMPVDRSAKTADPYDPNPRTPRGKSSKVRREKGRRKGIEPQDELEG